NQVAANSATRATIAAAARCRQRRSVCTAGLASTSTKCCVRLTTPKAPAVTARSDGRCPTAHRLVGVVLRGAAWQHERDEASREGPSVSKADRKDAERKTDGKNGVPDTLTAIPLVDPHAVAVD